MLKKYFESESIKISKMVKGVIAKTGRKRVLGLLPEEKEEEEEEEEKEEEEEGR